MARLRFSPKLTRHVDVDRASGMGSFRRGLFLTVIAVVVSALACGHGGMDDGGAASSSAALSAPPAPAATPSKSITFDLVYPKGYGVNTVAIGASDELALAPHDTVLTA